MALYVRRRLGNLGSNQLVLVTTCVHFGNGCRYGGPKRTAVR